MISKSSQLARPMMPAIIPGPAHGQKEKGQKGALQLHSSSCPPAMSMEVPQPARITWYALFEAAFRLCCRSAYLIYSFAMPHDNQQLPGLSRRSSSSLILFFPCKLCLYSELLTCRHLGLILSRLRLVHIIFVSHSGGLWLAAAQNLPAAQSTVLPSQGEPELPARADKVD